MDDTTKGIISRIAVPGDPLRWNTAVLNPNELARMAADAVGHLDESIFDVAIGIAYSGVLFAAAVAGGHEVSILQQDGKFWGPSIAGKKVIIVDDQARDLLRLQDGFAKAQAAGGTVVGFAVLIDATAGASGTLPAPLWSAYLNA
jgi:orotate phosphoribosyltransferase